MSVFHPNYDRQGGARKGCSTSPAGSAGLLGHCVGFAALTDPPPAGGKTSGHPGTTVTILLQERHLSSGALGKLDKGQFNMSKGQKWILNQGKDLNISKRDVLSIAECTHSCYWGSLEQPYLGSDMKTCYEIQNLAST